MNTTTHPDNVTHGDASKHTRPPLSPRRVWAARVVAVAVDGLQWVFLPLLGVGFVSPVQDVVDVITGIVMIVLVGWHWAFVPSFIVEVIPGVGLVPTWTLAVFFATRKRT